jgi:hypothetical protein
MREVEARQDPGDLLEFGERLTLFRFNLSPREQQWLDAMLLRALATQPFRDCWRECATRGHNPPSTWC